MLVIVSFHADKEDSIKEKKSYLSWSGLNYMCVELQTIEDLVNFQTAYGRNIARLSDNVFYQ